MRWYGQKMCCDLVGSVRSRQHWFRDISRKRNEFLLFSIVLRILQLLIPLVDSSRVFIKMYLSKWALQANRKLKMSHIRLPTDSTRSHHKCWSSLIIDYGAQYKKFRTTLAPNIFHSMELYFRFKHSSGIYKFWKFF